MNILYRITADHYPFKKGETKNLEEWNDIFNVDITPAFARYDQEIELQRGVSLERMDSKMFVSIHNGRKDKNSEYDCYRITVDGDCIDENTARKILEEVLEIVKKYNPK